ncbi:MAG: carotenoid oxygenase family protein [Chroococcidiopsidaceae cyanobacterium CP_BM_RX_35]|nr:carotenoid oxygenase family protein [Chroococcidiopsidaceae cyanobacterium CP_BM_RX_35]
MMTTTLANPFLTGNFAPVREEILVDRLTVIGKLPSDLSGTFVRNGPNPQFAPKGHYHWFDGDGMLHGVRLCNGNAQYCNRYVRTKGFEIERAEGEAVWTGLLEPPQMENPYGPYKNTANTALVWHDGHLLALWEGGEPHEIKVPGLETVGPFTYNGTLISAFTAHPKVDAITGEMMFFGYSVATPPYLQYSVVSAAGELLRTVPIDLPVGVMMHDFAVSEYHTIFMDLPLTFRPERPQQGQPAFAFEPESPSRFGILPRHGDNSNIRWFEAPACYVFHTLNAYEEGDEVVLTACRMNSTDVLGMSETLEHHRESDTTDDRNDAARLYCWRFNLATGAVREEALDDCPSDFPRLNEQLTGRQTRYGYTARFAPSQAGESPRFDGLIKYDFATGRSETHEFGRGRYGGEGVFAPRTSAVAEDDGWLLTFVHNEIEGKSELVVVNAQDMNSEPVARILIPQRVPYGFHGIWVADEQMATQAA